jgi:hypothetical protein
MLLFLGFPALFAIDFRSQGVTSREAGGAAHVFGLTLAGGCFLLAWVAASTP